jgi:acyl dehydratase
MKFSEFKVGQFVTAGRRRITMEEIADFPGRWDSAWFHTDPVPADGRWKGLTATSWMTCSIALQLVLANVLHDAQCIGTPSLEEVKWPTPLRPGDEVELRCEVLETRLSSSKTLGILRWRWVLSTQTGAQVLTLIVTNLFDL